MPISYPAAHRHGDGFEERRLASSIVAYRAAVDADEVAEELYALPPEQFTAARNARAKEANAAGDKAAAARIAALRKPTVLAWLVNLLVRELPDEIGAFLDLGEALREATATLSGPELRELSGQRHRLVQALVRQARELARQAGYRLTEDVARGLEETLAAALTDPAVAEQLRAGRLTSGLTATGFPTPSPSSVRAHPPLLPSRAVRSQKQTTPDALPAQPSAAERRRQQAMVRLQRDLLEAERRTEKAEQAQAVTAEAFEESQRALAEAEMAVADLRAELEHAVQTRDQAKRDSERAQAADAKAAVEAERSGRRVTELLARIEAL
ncbi:MAG: hypothetical protein QOD68_1774 [Actinomycetota bacterium]|jgi:hypothetical protein|nr:hypothetical protein [Actinomycetota bacterium]